MSELGLRVKKYFRYEWSEAKNLLITSIICAFAVTLAPGWGVFEAFKEKTYASYAVNLLLMFLLFLIILLAHFSSQKIVGLKLGYNAEYNSWINGLFLTVILCFLSYGYLPLFFAGALLIKDIPKLRMGAFRGGVMQKDLALISFAGPLTNLLIAGICGPIYAATKSGLIYTFIVINLLTAIWSLLPIPTFEKIRQFKGGTTGLYLFIASRWVFVLVFTTVLVFSMLVFIAQIFSFILSLLIGVIVTVIYYNSFE